MNVMSLMHQASPAEVARIYNETYNTNRNDGWGTVEAFNEFRVRLGDVVGVREGDDQFKCVVQWIDYHWGGKDNNEYHEQYFSVGGRMIRDPDQTYSLSMTDWGVWKEMEVEDETDKNLSIDELATHIYYEITWFGWQDQMVDKRDEITDQVEQIDRDFSEWKKGDPLPEGYIDLGDYLKGLDNNSE